MAFQAFLTIISSGLAGVCIWFLYDLVKEMKSFKHETGRDILRLNQERQDFKDTVKSHELATQMRVNELRQIQGEFSTTIKSQLVDVNHELRLINDQTKSISENHAKAIKISQALYGKVKVLEDEIKSLKIKVIKD